MVDVNLETATALEAAMSRGQLPADVRPMAEKIVERLQSVTRIGILGRAQSGKSTVAKLLAGSDVGIEVFGSAPLRMHYADEAMVTATLTDGSSFEGPGVDDLDEIAELEPALVTLRMPLPALKKISLLELRVSEDHGEAVKALNWALKHTDIAIWCTEFFTGDEQGLWASMPDVIKDHAMLLRTKADTLDEPWDIAEDRLRTMVRGEFAHVFAASAEQGVAARSASGEVNKAAMKQSGSTKVISTILRELDSAKRAAADQGDMLLRKHGLVSNDSSPQPEPEQKAEASAEESLKAAPVATKAPKAKAKPVSDDEAKPKPAKEAAPKPATVKAAPKPAPAQDSPKAAVSPKRATVNKAQADQTAAKPMSPSGKSAQEKLKSAVKPVPVKPTAKGAPKSRIAAATAKAKADKGVAPTDKTAPAKGTSAKPVLVPIESDTDALDGKEREALVEASVRLRETGLSLTQDKNISPKDVLAKSIEVIDHVADRLSQLDADAHPAVGRALEAAGYAADTLDLLKAEDTACDMVETVSLLLQVKRGIDADLAAAKAKGEKG